MTELDHRPFTIPLFTLGAALLVAGIIGLVVAGTTDLATNNPGGAAAAGGILIFGAYAVAALLHPTSTVAETRVRTIPGVGAFSLAVILLAAVAGGSALGGASEPGPALGAGGAPGTGAAATLGLLRSDELEGTLQGASAPGPLGMLGGASSPVSTHDVTPPTGSRTLRAELRWTAEGVGGAGTLVLRVEDDEGEELGRAEGAGELVLDVAVTNEDAGFLRVVVSLPEGAATSGQDYVAYASWFDGAVPSGFTAHP